MNLKLKFDKSEVLTISLEEKLNELTNVNYTDFNIDINLKGYSLLLIKNIDVESFYDDFFVFDDLKLGVWENRFILNFKHLEEGLIKQLEDMSLRYKLTLEVS